MQTRVLDPSVGHPDSRIYLSGQCHLVFPHVAEMPRTRPPRFIAESGEVPHGLLPIQRIAQ